MTKARKSTGPRPRVNNAPVTLTAVLDAPQGMDLHVGLGPLLHDPATVVVNAGKVERIDTLALQVLLVFVMARRAAGHAVEWSDVSAEFRRATDLLGLSKHLGLA